MSYTQSLSSVVSDSLNFLPVKIHIDNYFFLHASMLKEDASVRGTSSHTWPEDRYLVKVIVPNIVCTVGYLSRNSHCVLTPCQGLVNRGKGRYHGTLMIWYRLKNWTVWEDLWVAAVSVLQISHLKIWFKLYLNGLTNANVSSHISPHKAVRPVLKLLKCIFFGTAGGRLFYSHRIRL